METSKEEQAVGGHGKKNGSGKQQTRTKQNKQATASNTIWVWWWWMWWRLLLMVGARQISTCGTTSGGICHA